MSTTAPIRPAPRPISSETLPSRSTQTQATTAVAPDTDSEVSAKRPRWRFSFGMLPFVIMHLALVSVIWTGFPWQALVLCAVLFVVRMFGVTGGYHRYFSHRTFKTSRVGQFVLAWIAQSSAQKGALWWAAHHRHHHRESDTPEDVHSPGRHGFWYAHLGWLFDNNDETDVSSVRDLAKYPELVWLNKYHLVPAIALGVGSWLFLGWGGLVVGFILSTVLLWHATFSINSLNHMIGKTRFKTGDDSRNSLPLAILTMGEGWHNNHHHYMMSTRQGFYWWEIDLTYYILKVLSWMRLVWDIREPPKKILDEGRALDRAA